MYSPEKIQEAGARRTALRTPGTNAFRLVDGSGDGVPDLYIDSFADHWLVSTPGPALDMSNFAGMNYRSLFHKVLAQESKQPPQQLAGTKPGRFLVSENGLYYWIDCLAGYSPGLFLDQRANRQLVRERTIGKSVLNTFAYTCAFGVAAAAGGARTINVDLSRSYLEWGKKNYLANRITLDRHEFIYGDVFDWLKRFQKRSTGFDLIILDPPTFSRNRRGQVFRAPDDYAGLLAQARKILNSAGWLLICNNTHGFSRSAFESRLSQTLDCATLVHWSPLPVDFPGSSHLKSAWLQFG